MNIPLQAAHRKLEQKFFAFLALLGENLLALGLLAAVFTRVFLLRHDFIHSTLLPGLGLEAGLACLLSAWMARQLSRGNFPTPPCALPVGFNRWFLLLVGLVVWLPSFRDLGPSNLAGRQTWELACALTVVGGLAQVSIGLLWKCFRGILQPASLGGLVLSLALASLLAGSLPSMMEYPHIAIPVVGVLLFRSLARLPLPFGLTAPIVALGVGAAVAWGSGQFQSDLPVWALPSPNPSATVGFAFLWSNRGALPGWFWVGVALACHSALLDLAQVERASLSGDQYCKRSFLVSLGLVNVVGGLLGSCIPCSILLGHSVYKRLAGGSVYVQGTGLCLLGLSLTGTLPYLLMIVPEAAWAPLSAWILLRLCSTELEFCAKSSPLGAICATLPIFATFFWLNSQGWLISSDPDFSMLTAKHASSPWMHTLGIATLAQGAVVTSLLWGTIAACCQNGLTIFTRVGPEAAEEPARPPALAGGLERRSEPRGGPLPHGFREALYDIDKASWLAFLACFLSVVGFIHSPTFGWNLGPLAAVYLLLAVACHWGYVVELERLGLPSRSTPPVSIEPEELRFEEGEESPDI